MPSSLLSPLWGVSGDLAPGWGWVPVSRVPAGAPPAGCGLCSPGVPGAPRRAPWRSLRLSQRLPGPSGPLRALPASPQPSGRRPAAPDPALGRRRAGTAAGAASPAAAGVEAGPRRLGTDRGLSLVLSRPPEQCGARAARCGHSQAAPLTLPSAPKLPLGAQWAQELLCKRGLRRRRAGPWGWADTLSLQMQPGGAP